MPTAGTLSVGALDRLAVTGRFAASMEGALTLGGTPASGTTLDVTFTTPASRWRISTFPTPGAAR